jgi:hypothetical protein
LKLSDQFQAFERALEERAAAAKIFTRVEAVRADVDSVIRRHDMAGPLCHLGSKLHNPEKQDAAAFRRQFSALGASDYVGFDIEPGENVDVVCDLADDRFRETHPGEIGKYGVSFCWALLEHVKNPFQTAANISALTRPGGHLYFAGPWVWGYHAYPDDYWRLSFSAIKLLFPQFEFDEWFYASTTYGLGLKITDQDQTIERKIFQMLSDDVTENALFTDRGLPYLNIVAIGRKTGDD